MAATLIGLIADTHGLLRPTALAALAGCDVIVHAGDIGDPAILTALGRLGPVTAIRGNIDRGVWAQALPDTAVLPIGPTLVFVLHDLKTIDIDPVAAGFGVVVSGHSHRPGFHTRDGVLTINPGSAGPRRFSLPVTVGRITIQQSIVSAEIVPID